MSLPTLVIHVVPLQIDLAGSIATLTCNDPRARIVEDEIEFTLNKPSEGDPPAQQRFRFVIEDPPDTATYDNYLNMSSAPPLEKLVAWKRVGNVSHSPDMVPGHDFEIVAVAYGVPRTGSSNPVKIGHGRVRFRTRLTGLPGGDIF